MTSTDVISEEGEMFCKAQYRIAKEMLEKKGSVLSTWFIKVGENYDPEFEGKAGNIVAIPALTEDKDMLSSVLRMMAVRVNAEFVASMMECWATKVDMNTTPPTHNRREAIIIQFEDSAGTWIALADITRLEDGTPHIPDDMPELVCTPESGGRLSGVMPPQEMAGTTKEFLIANDV